MSSATPIPPSSPPWSPTTKLVVGLSFVGIIVALLIYFRSIIGPLLLAFVLAYLLHPLAVRVSRTTNLGWRWSVNLIYLVLIILTGGLLTLSGLAIIQQFQSLIRVVENFTDVLPGLIADLSMRSFTFGPFEFNFSQFDLQSMTNQLLGTLQAMIGRLGGLVSSFAASAATTFGWGLFVLLISYFLLAESRQVSDQVSVEFIEIDLPEYDYDIRSLYTELRNIWNAFLRGQLIITLLAILLYTILMSLLGVRYSLGIAILAGLGRFVPYIGPLVVWVVLTLVTLFQSSNYFGLVPYQYTLLVLVLAIVLDQVIDNYINPRFLGRALGVHPAAVLVAALIAANLIGVIGLLLAAPVLATMKLLAGYLVRKMLDLDPWPPSEVETKVVEFPWSRGTRRLRAWLRLNRRG
ncbi:MAG TPA: AI-2E family transporter [Anaerolineales bacterium]